MKSSLTFRVFMFVPVVLLCVSGTGVSQTPVLKPVVTIDGSKEPGKVPEWILWREMLRVAAQLAEQSPTRGEEVWVARLGLSAAQATEIIGRGALLRTYENTMNQEVRRLIGAAGRVPSAAAIERLRQMQGEHEAQILALRDQLRSRLGEEAFQRMQSFARIRIAPGVKVGELFPGPDTVGTPVGPPPVRK